MESIALMSDEALEQRNFENLVYHFREFLVAVATDITVSWEDYSDIYNKRAKTSLMRYGVLSHTKRDRVSLFLVTERALGVLKGLGLVDEEVGCLRIHPPIRMKRRTTYNVNSVVFLRGGHQRVE